MDFQCPSNDLGFCGDIIGQCLDERPTESLLFIFRRAKHKLSSTASATIPKAHGHWAATESRKMPNWTAKWNAWFSTERKWRIIIINNKSKIVKEHQEFHGGIVWYGHLTQCGASLMAHAIVMGLELDWWKLCTAVGSCTFSHPFARLWSACAENDCAGSFKSQLCWFSHPALRRLFVAWCNFQRPIWTSVLLMIYHWWHDCSWSKSSSLLIPCHPTTHITLFWPDWPCWLGMAKGTVLKLCVCSSLSPLGFFLT